MKLGGFCIMALGLGFAYAQRSSHEDVGMYGLFLALGGAAVVLEGFKRDLVEMLDDFAQHLRNN
ncbi:hypothetical protein HQ560_22080 [bacterium]|nr:hypothetical protein [bacterium]